MRNWTLVFFYTYFFIPGLGGCNTPPDDPIPEHQTFSIESKFMEETRVINVWLPPSYDSEADRKFPILYMPDGGLKEDFPHIANTIADLIAAGKMEEVVLVGIENTVRRRDMTSPTEVEKDREVAPVVGWSGKFRAFIRDELTREVETRYRSTGETGIIGESLAGCFIMECFFVEPDMFDKYIAISPSLWWNDHELVKKAAERIPKHEGLGNSLYLTSANETDIYIYTDSLEKILQETAPPDLKWSYTPRRDLLHSTIYRAVKEDSLIKLYGK